MAFKLEDYMEQVEMWFEKYEISHNKTRRQIYLATDDEKVVRLVSPCCTLAYILFWSMKVDILTG